MKKIIVTVYGPSNLWSLTVTEGEFARFLTDISNGRMATLTKILFNGQEVDYTFNPAMIVAVEAIEDNNSPF